MSKFFRTPKLIGSGIVVAFILCVLFFKISASIEEVAHFLPTSDSRDYESTIAENRSLYTTHFPRNIPSNARESKFFYQPAVMQGAMRLQLRLVLSPEEIEKIRSDLRNQFVSHGFGNRRPNDSEDMMPRWLPAAKSDNNELADYEIFIIKRTSEEEWNHPKLSGIAISRKFNEVLYWYEDW